MTFYDDAELTALAVVREVVAESYEGAGHSAQVLDIIKPYAESHPGASGDGSAAVLGLVVALGRLAMTAWTVALKGRLGHYPTEQEWADELERFELSKLEQHQDPEDPIRQTEADEDEDATPCLTDAEIAAMLEAMHYPPGVKPPPPPPLPGGRVLVHNFPPLVDGRIVVRQLQGVNGFRFWLQDRSHPAGPQVEPCGCGFAPEHEVHYRVVPS